MRSLRVAPLKVITVDVASPLSSRAVNHMKKNIYNSSCMFKNGYTSDTEQFYIIIQLAQSVNYLWPLLKANFFYSNIAFI